MTTNAALLDRPSTAPSAAARGSRWRRWQPVLYIGPALVVLAGFLAYPIVDGVVTSFTNSSMVKPGSGQFVGLANFRALFDDPTFWPAVVRTGVWALSNLVLQVGLGMVLALVMHQRLVARGLFRSVVIIPWIAPTVVLAVIWSFLLDPTSGPINQFLISTGLVTNPPLWLADTTWALPTLTLISVWKWTPFVAVILLAGLQTIPPELHEAAMIDGAGRIQRFRYVVVPHLSTSIALASLLTVAYSVNNFNGIWLFTKGGPVGATDTLTTVAYRIAFQEFDLGKAAAVAVFIFFFMMIISTVYFYVIEGRKGRQA